LKRVPNPKQLYVYAIIDAPLAFEDMTGVADEPLSLVRGPECWLAASWIAPPLPPPSAVALRAQDALMRVLATRAEALLPLRFGTSFENETALQMRLAHFTATRIRNALTRVRGSEQMTLRVFEAPPPAPAPAASAESTAGPGTSYLTQRAVALATELSPLLVSLRDALGDVLRDEVLDTARRPPLIGSAYHLIARGDADRYRAAMSTCPPPPGVTWHATGPSPAYAFARDALS
jgi:hypothetical protein